MSLGALPAWEATSISESSTTAAPSTVTAPTA